MSARSFAVWLRATVGAVIASVSLWYILGRFDWSVLFLRIAGANYVLFFAGGGAAYMAFLVMRTWRWLLMVRQIHPAARFRDLYLAAAVSASFSMVAGQVGDAVKIEILKRAGVLTRTAGLGLFLTEKVLDLLVVAGFAILGLVTTPLGERYPELLHFLVAIAGAITLGLLAAWTVGRGGRAGGLIGRLPAALGRTRDLVAGLTLSVTSWLLVAVGWQVTLASVQVTISLQETITSMALTTLGILISFVPAGLGVAEVMISELLKGFGVTPELAQTGAIILRMHAFWMLGIGILHALYWLGMNWHLEGEVRR